MKVEKNTKKGACETQAQNPIRTPSPYIFYPLRRKNQNPHEPHRVGDPNEPKILKAQDLLVFIQK